MELSLSSILTMNDQIIAKKLLLYEQRKAVQYSAFA